MEYEIAEPKKNPIGALVIIYKLSKGIEYDDKVWDKIHFKRSSKSAKDLLGVCSTYETSKKCLEELSHKFNEMDISWTFETIVKHSHDWISKRSQRNDKSNKQRFSDAIAKQRSSYTAEGKGASFTAGEMLDAIGNLEIIRSDHRPQDGTGNTQDGRIGERIPPPGMEEKKAGGFERDKGVIGL